MKLNNQRIFDIEQFITKQNLIPDPADNLQIIEIFEKVIEPTIPYLLNCSLRTYRYIVQEQCLYVRANLARVKYLQCRKKASNIPEGFVYAISNPAFPDYIKIGSTVDVIERLSTYQTYSPFRDYELISYFFSYNRLSDEKNIISMFESKNEWCKVSVEDITEIFKRKLKSDRFIQLPKHMYENKVLSRKMEKLYFAASDRDAIVLALTDIHDIVFGPVISNNKKVGQIIRTAKMPEQWIKDTGMSADHCSVYNNYNLGWSATVTTGRNSSKQVVLKMRRANMFTWDDVPSVLHCNAEDRWGVAVPASNKHHKLLTTPRTKFRNKVKSKPNSFESKSKISTAQEAPKKQVKIIYKKSLTAN